VMNPALPSINIIPQEGLLTDVTDSRNPMMGYCVVFGTIASGII